MNSILGEPRSACRRLPCEWSCHEVSWIGRLLKNGPTRSHGRWSAQPVGDLASGEFHGYWRRLNVFPGGSPLDLGSPLDAECLQRRAAFRSGGKRWAEDGGNPAIRDRVPKQACLAFFPPWSRSYSDSRTGEDRKASQVVSQARVTAVLAPRERHFILQVPTSRQCSQGAFSRSTANDLGMSPSPSQHSPRTPLPCQGHSRRTPKSLVTSQRAP